MSILKYSIAFTTILRKELVRVFRIWKQALLPSAITSILYFVIFGHVVGSQLNLISGFTYIQYIAPGLIMMAVITNSYANVVSSFYGARFARNIEELLIAPIPNALILIGFVAGGVVRGLLVGLIVTVLALFFTKLELVSLFVTISIVLLTAILFSLAGFLNGIFAKTFDDTSIIPTFILTPLTYLGGVFYSVHLLPDFWRSISFLNPVLYMVDTFRYGILGIVDMNVIFSFSIIIALIILLFCINLRLLNKGFNIKT